MPARQKTVSDPHDNSSPSYLLTLSEKGESQSMARNLRWGGGGGAQPRTLSGATAPG
jgi:hypothetical protein